MSISSNATNVKDAIAGFAPVFKAALQKKANTTTTADNSTKLNNRTNLETSTDLKAPTTTHAGLVTNPHTTTAAQAGAYTSTEVDVKLNKRIPSSIFPISRFGELNYLDAGVSGSYEGATTNFESRQYPLIVENDGTLVYLRNGTNGSTTGIYYAYMRNAMGASMSAPVRTTRKYRPAYFPAGMSGRALFKSDSRVIAGQLQNEQGVPGDYFVSICNGTFDDSLHDGCIISAANMPPRPSGNPEFILGNDAIFIIIPQANAALSPVEFAIWQIPLASITNDPAVPVQITGFTTQGFYGSYNNLPCVRVSNTKISSNVADKPVSLRPASSAVYYDIFLGSSGGQSTHSAQDPVTGKLRIRCTGDCYLTNSDFVTTGRPWVFFSVLVDLVAKTAALDAGTDTPAELSFSATGVPQYSGTCLTSSSDQSVPANWRNSFDSLFYHQSGYWFSINDQNLPDSPFSISRSSIPAGVTSRFAALVGNVHIFGRVQGAYNPAYGSAIGGKICGSTVLPGGRRLVYSLGAGVDGETSQGLVLCDVGAAGWTYKSQYSGSFPGYAPAVKRDQLSDLGLDEYAYAALISEITTGGVVSTYGSFFVENFKNSGFLSCNSDLVPTGAVSIDPAVYASVRAGIFAALGLAVNYTTSNVLIIVPQNPTIPPFGFMCWVNSDREEKSTLCELGIVTGARNGHISAMNVLTVGSVGFHSATATAVNVNVGTTLMSGGITILETADAYLVGGASKAVTGRTGNSGGQTFRFAIPKSTNRPDWANLRIGGYPIFYDTVFYTYVPGKGLGQLNQTIGLSDGYTKMVFVPCATNLTTFNSWVALSPTLVILSQDMAEGWVVYFTSKVPILMAGKSFMMPVSSIDLETIAADPSNKTFFLYVKLIAGVPKYVITTVAVAEKFDCMFVGTIVTGGAAITSMDVQKVTRIETYRLSTTAKGSAVAVTAGLPNSPEALEWI